MSAIGIMGGTFDPVHIGHIALAQHARTEFELDRILFLPNHNQWMKKDREITPDIHRVQMVRLAVEGIPGFEVSLAEIEAGGVSYTYRTLEILKEQYPDETLYFIMGADSLLTLECWVEPAKVMKYAHLLAAVRNDCDMVQLNAQKSKLEQHYDARIDLLHMPPVDISSTQIRQNFYHDPAIRQMLPAKVASYIIENNLYHSQRG